MNGEVYLFMFLSRQQQAKKTNYTKTTTKQLHKSKEQVKLQQNLTILSPIP
jgi:hypothetical protein